MRVDRTDEYARWIDARQGRCGSRLLLLLAEGDKSSQSKDIELAIKLAQNCWE